METFSNIDVILGERLDLDSVNEDPPKRNENGQRIVRTLKGREIAADLIVRYLLFYYLCPLISNSSCCVPVNPRILSSLQPWILPLSTQMIALLMFYGQCN